jgi:hypothetical protein
MSEMTQVLDIRVSENSTIRGFPDTRLANINETPSFIGDIGLIVGAAQNVRVNLWSTVGLQNQTFGTVTIRFFIARNLVPTDVFILSNVIFFAERNIESFPYDEVPIVTINAADFAAVAGPPNQINYSFFAQSQSEEVDVTRIGPESFTGMAYVN